MRYSTFTYYLLATFASLAFLSGCSNEDILGIDNSSEKKEEVKLQFQLNLQTNGKASSRAIADEMAGTDAENEIKSIHLFIVDKNTNDINTYSLTDKRQFPNNTVTFPINTIRGLKNIFVGTNLSKEQAAEFVEGYKTARTKAAGIMTKFRGDETLETMMAEVTTQNGFVMFGQATMADNTTIKDIDLSVVEPGSTIELNADVTRIVSKVLVTWEQDENNRLTNVPYGYVTDVRYTIAVINRKFYYMEQPNNEDPNYSMNELVNDEGTTDGKSEMPDNFQLYGFDGIIMGDPGNKKSEYNAPRFDESRFDPNSENPYTEGVYCLENTVKNDTKLTGELLEKGARNVTTFLIIGMQFTPKYIIHDGKKHTYSYEDAAALIERYKKDGKYEVYAYSFAKGDDRKYCYLSLGDLNKYNGTNYTDDLGSGTAYTAYKGGWCQRWTFIDGQNIDGKLSFSENSGLKRNHYYFVNITGLSYPVSSNTIEINTKSYGWSLKGRTTVDVETNN